MNSNENQVTIEVFQPEINSQIKRTTLEEVREWIKDGKLQPNHQVRVKNLSWVEAHKIPAFQALFESKKKEQTEQLNQSYNQTLTVASEPVRPLTAEEKPFPKAKFFSLKKESNSADKEKSAGKTSAESESKTAQSSVVFQAYEKKVLAKAKETKNKTKSFEITSESQKKSPFRKKISSAAKNKSSFSNNKKSVARRIAFFLAGCFLSAILSYGGSYFWVYQLKTSAQIDEKSLPEIASLDDKLTSDKLGLRLKEEARKKELKESGNQENPAQHQDISQQIAQLEKQFDASRKTVIENQKIKLQEADFNATFSFSLVALLVAFVLVGVFYGNNPQAVKTQKSSKIPDEPDVDSAEFQTVNEQEIDEEFSQNGGAEQTTEKEKSADDNENLVESNSADFQDRSESFSKIIYVSENVSESANAFENISEEKSQLSIQCFQHCGKSPEFYCDICENYFCADCTKTVSESGNRCPYCKLNCKPIEIRASSESSTQSAPEEKKKPNLLELGKDSNFVVYDYPDERTRKLGIIPAIIIAALFSASISIFWVYKISPYLENRNSETVQTVAPEEKKTSEQTAGKNVETSGAATNITETQNVPDDSCVDPISKEIFKCDDETRKALYEQNRKTQSVENAQKKAAEKTSALSGLAASSPNSPAENAVRENPKLSETDEAQKEFEKQQLIKTFGISFVMIFGLLMLSRFFSKEKAQD